MASFKKHGNGYQGTIYVGRKADGTKDNIFVQADTLRECKALARQVEDDIERRRISNFRNTKVADFCADYLRRHKNELADTTYINYKMYADRHFKPFFKSMKFSKVTEFHLKDYKAEKLEYLSPTTVRKHMLFMRMVFAEAKFKHLFDEVSIPQNQKFVPVVPTDEQFDLIISKTKMKKHELIELIAGRCGLRLGEIFALKWDDIDFKTKEMRIDESFAREEAMQYGLKEPKSDNGYRKVPCSDEILEKLKDYKADPYKSKRGFLKKNVVPITGQIFDGRPDNFSNNFGKKMDKLGMGEIRFHDLRHYYASWLYRNGIPDHVAAELMGHDIAVLKGIYQHLGLIDRAKHKDRIRELQNSMATEKATKSM
jgi:integrase